VEAFGNARQQVLDFARRPLNEITSEGSGKRKREVEEISKEGGASKRTRGSGRTTRSTPQHVEILDSDDDYAPGASRTMWYQRLANSQEKKSQMTA